MNAALGAKVHEIKKGMQYSNQKSAQTQKGMQCSGPKHLCVCKRNTAFVEPNFFWLKVILYSKKIVCSNCWINGIFTPF